MRITPCSQDLTLCINRSCKGTHTIHTPLTKSPVHIPAVPILQLPLIITHVTNVTHPVNSANTLTNVSSNSSDIAGLLVTTTTAAATACIALANKTPVVEQEHPTSCLDLAQHFHRTVCIYYLQHVHLVKQLHH